MQRKVAYLVWWVVIAGLGVGLWFYFDYRDRYPSTDDAYVVAHVVHMAAQVSGPVTEINVKNNQWVEEGQPLFTIDARPFKEQLNKAAAGMQLARQQMQVDLEAVHVAESQLQQAQAKVTVERKNFKRIDTLVKKGQASMASGDEARSRLQVAEANLAEAKNQLQRTKENLGDVGERNAQFRRAKAAHQLAQLQRNFANVTAPASGYITNFSLRVGTMVTSGQPLFQLVESEPWWVEANFKETQLERMKPGQVATITLDMYPKHEFKGIVESISRSSGVVFSLLPPENATGNWVKVTQRFSVKILIQKASDDTPLRMGASANVKVDTASDKTTEAD